MVYILVKFIFSFPRDVHARDMWIAVLGLAKNIVLPKRAELCSQHFNQEDFEVKPSGRRCLRKDAIPQSVHSLSPSHIR